MTFEFIDIEADLNDLRSCIQRHLADGEERAKLLKEFLLRQADLIGLHYQLMKAEQKSRYYLSEKDFLELTDKWLAVRRRFRHIPRAQPKSLYEHETVNSMYETLSFHFDEMTSSWASTIAQRT